MLTLKILGFAALSESAGVSKVLKIILGLLVTFMAIYYTFYLSRKGFEFKTKFSNTLVLAFYLLYIYLGIVSIFWADDYVFSMIQIFRDFDILVFCILFLRIVTTLNKYYSKVNLTLSYLLVYAVFFNTLYFLLGYLIDPDRFMRLTHGGEVARLGGTIMNPNELGMLSSLGASLVILELSTSSKKVLLFIFLLSNLYVMFLTGSRSSSIGFILVCGLVILKSNNMKLKVGMFSAMLFIVPIAANEIIFNEEKGGVEEVMSMTGRLPFWKALLTEGLPNEPLLGFGFMNIYYTKYFQGKDTYPASMTHNTFVQVVMNLGLVGFFIVLFQMILTFRAVLREKNFEKQFQFYTLFIPIFINSLTEFGIWGETNYGIIFYHLLFLLFVIESKLPQNSVVLSK